MNVTRHHGDNSGRGLSGFWANCPLSQLQHDLGKGALFMDDFLTFAEATAQAELGTFGRYLTMGDTGATITQVTSVADARVDAGNIVVQSNSDDDSCGLRWGSAPFQITSNAGDNKNFWFEARIKKSALTNSKIGIFLGLMEDTAITTDIPLVASGGALADKNLVGFHNLEGDGDTFDTVYRADGVTAVTLKADAVTVVADTYVKLGMYYDARDSKLFFYKNGVKVAAGYTVPASTGLDFPDDVCMGPILVINNASSSTPGSCTMDWWAAAQLF